MDVIKKFSAFYTDLESMKLSELPLIYSANITFIDPIAEHHGLAAIEAYFSKLLHNAKFCKFSIHSAEQTLEGNYVVVWTMSYTSSRVNKGQAISLDGITLLKIENEKVIYHRDYYDMGQMVYEHVPLLGRIVKRIKKGML